MKNTIQLLFAIFITCIACENNNNNPIPQLFSHFTFDSTMSDKNGYSTNSNVVFHSTTSSFYHTPNGIGKVGSCISLSANATVNCADNLFANYTTQHRKLKNYSVSFWMKVNDVSGNEQNLCINNSSPDLDFLNMVLRNDSLVMAYPDFSTFPNIVKFKSVEFNKYDWNNIIITCDNFYKVYLNGILVHNAQRTVNNSQQHLSDLSIGNDVFTTGLFMYVDELIVYNYPITQTEVTDYYNLTK